MFYDVVTYYPVSKERVGNVRRIKAITSRLAAVKMAAKLDLPDVECHVGWEDPLQGRKSVIVTVETTEY